MTSFTLQGSILQVIAIHTRASWVIACVNREWLEAVNAARNELTRGFLGSVCILLCLRPAEYDNSLVDKRLQREVRLRFHRGAISEDRLWWCRTQLYMHHAAAVYHMSFQAIFRRCHLFSIHSGYDFHIFEDVCRHRTSENLDEPLDERLFWNGGYVSARDLGCINLGRSIDDVLQTLICAKAGTKYCPNMCGCAEEDRQMLRLGAASPARGSSG